MAITHDKFENEVLKELELFRSRLEDHLEGRAQDEGKWKSYRLRHGVYGQKQDDVFMLRIRIPHGRLTRNQIVQIAHIIDHYSIRPSSDIDAGEVGHITTRQAIQIHFVPLDKVPQIQELLAEVGLTGRDACGDAVRNIVAPALAGIDPSHPFDITPYADWINDHCLRNPELEGVPRKFKIAFAGSPSERSQTLINDLGFEAKRNDSGERGFRVTLGGGLGVPPTLAKVLYDFLPETKALALTRAVLHVFLEHTEKKNRKRMRFKFIIRRFGWEKTVKMIEKELRKYSQRSELLSAPPADRINFHNAKNWLEEKEQILAQRNDPSFQNWMKNNVHAQSQSSFVAIRIRTDRGDLTSSQLRSLADFSAIWGRSEARTDRDQNIVIPFISTEDLGRAYDHLCAIDLARVPSGGKIDPVSCPGGETCNLAVTKSRALAKKIEESLDAWSPYADDHTSIRISGCPNSCGQHVTATIGFWGTAKRVGDRLLPCYELMVGGGDNGKGKVSLAKMIGRVASIHVPDVLEVLLAYYLENRNENEFLSSFFARANRDQLREFLEPFLGLPDVENLHQDFFFEWFQSKTL